MSGSASFVYGAPMADVEHTCFACGRPTEPDAAWCADCRAADPYPTEPTPATVESSSRPGPS